MTKHLNSISKKFKDLARKRDLSTVFNDFLTMALCSHHRTNYQSKLKEKDPKNEAAYLATSKHYERTEINRMAEILGTLHVSAFDNPYSDILGEFFMQEISNGHNGQYFTPEPVCEMMAALQAEKNSVTGQKVMDPACGSGRMLMAFAKANYKNSFFGADISSACAKMAALNFFVNGMKGEVAWMDSLAMKFHGAWKINTKGLGILPIPQHNSVLWHKPPEKETFNLFNGQEKTPTEQLSLF